jgi:hypothetical protein
MKRCTKTPGTFYGAQITAINCQLHLDSFRQATKCRFKYAPENAEVTHRFVMTIGGELYI